MAPPQWRVQEVVGPPLRRAESRAASVLVSAQVSKAERVNQRTEVHSRRTRQNLNLILTPGLNAPTGTSHGSEKQIYIWCSFFSSLFLFFTSKQHFHIPYITNYHTAVLYEHTHTYIETHSQTRTFSMWQRAWNVWWFVSISSQSSCQHEVGLMTSGSPYSTDWHTPSAWRTLSHTHNSKIRRCISLN